MGSDLGPAETLNVLLHEYDALLAESRIHLEGQDKKLQVTTVIAVALFSAGIGLKTGPEHAFSADVLLLTVPYFILLVANFSLAQGASMILIGSELAVLEKRINGITGKKLLNWNSETVPAFWDKPWIRVPNRKRRMLSFTSYFGIIMWLSMFCLSGLSVYLGWDTLIGMHEYAGIVYLGALLSFTLVLAVMYTFMLTMKQHLIALIERSLQES